MTCPGSHSGQMAEPGRRPRPACLQRLFSLAGSPSSADRSPLSAEGRREAARTPGRRGARLLRAAAASDLSKKSLFRTGRRDAARDWQRGPMPRVYGATSRPLILSLLPPNHLFQGAGLAVDRWRPGRPLPAGEAAGWAVTRCEAEIPSVISLHGRARPATLHHGADRHQQWLPADHSDSRHLPPQGGSGPSLPWRGGEGQQDSGHPPPTTPAAQSLGTVHGSGFTNFLPRGSQLGVGDRYFGTVIALRKR